MSPLLEGTIKVLEYFGGIGVELIDGLGVIVIIAGVVIVLSMIGGSIYSTLKKILNGHGK